MRCRSALVPSASISFAAEALIRRLYSATPFQALDELVKARTLFLFSFSKGGKVFGVFGEGGLDTIRCRGLQAESAVYVGLKVHSCAFRCVHESHFNVMTLQRQGVAAPSVPKTSAVILSAAKDLLLPFALL
jgi:hypothetical protein